MSAILGCLLSYLIGSIPTGLILGKLLWGVDLREHGSHNIGATNAWRTLGKGPGIIIFLLDFLKGVIGVALGMYFAGTPLMMVLGGIMAIVGHSWSILLKFKGGKGVATGLGVIVMLMPSTALMVFLIWFVIVLITKYVSLGSIVAAACVPLFAWLFNQPCEYIVFSVLAAVFVIYRHKTNIGRLLNGTESKIKAGHRT
ncbi:glycerol-3-phosphate 1-O-acyltransferase PlsY [Schwartzia succinivorans]|uniref:Glycerol-3-phosphate acyltransferase n=1 Tax=Schwartzia succinivorans DSM 10502 TaxID=1123243 RepID=A0A1M4W0B7_9FIRM|nr:glycerol-3-phosphate acyltransferase PlsY [Schwartzia succinivorans DSM 10502]